MELENIMLNEINQTRKDKYHKSHMQNLDFFFFKERHESRRGTIWEEKGDWGRGPREDNGMVNIIKVLDIHI
jgi:hypothetical protein